MDKFKDENKDKRKSRLVFDMRMVRALLKRNPDMPAKYCRYCGELLSSGCGCVQPLEIIDVKKARDTENGTIAVFANSPEFKIAFAEIIEEFKIKDAAKVAEENKD